HGRGCEGWLRSAWPDPRGCEPVPAPCRPALRRSRGVNLARGTEKAAITLPRPTSPPQGARSRKGQNHMRVFVLDQNRKPLDPCSPARARYLLAKRRAAVFRRFPFTIILKDRTAEDSAVHPHRLNIDPG